MTTTRFYLFMIEFNKIMLLTLTQIAFYIYCNRGKIFCSFWVSYTHLVYYLFAILNLINYSKCCL